jgi:hypothetical protein
MSPISCVILNVQNGSRTLLMSPRCAYLLLVSVDCETII